MKHSTSTMVLTANVINNPSNETNNRNCTDDNNENLAAPLHCNQSTCYTKRSLIFDIVIIISVIVPIIICEYCVQPHLRGFFCNDESIRYPYAENTISSLNLGLIVLLVPLFVFGFIEYMRQRLCIDWTLAPALLPGCMVEIFGHYGYYLFGLALTLNATEIGKFTIGRLRPHFFTVCQPRMLDGSSCADIYNQDRYIEQYYCTGLQTTGGGRFTEDDLREARLSFPSGHSSLIWYCMVYLVIYMQYRLPKYHVSYLGKFLVQFTFLAFAWFVGLTRITDNFHHWSDVLAGGILGIIGALLTCYVANLNMPRLNRQILLPHATTPLTLKEVSVLTTN